MQIKRDSTDKQSSNVFTGKELDAETGLYYNSARYRQPKYNIWMSTDPARYSLQNPASRGYNPDEGLNPYAYVDHNPLKYTDPTGNEGVDYLALTSAPSPSLSFPVTMKAIAPPNCPVPAPSAGSQIMNGLNKLATGSDITGNGIGITNMISPSKALGAISSGALGIIINGVLLLDNLKKKDTNGSAENTFNIALGAWSLLHFISFISMAPTLLITGDTQPSAESMIPNNNLPFGYKPPEQSKEESPARSNSTPNNPSNNEQSNVSERIRRQSKED